MNWTDAGGGTQSFAKIARADTAQLARLPGFGPKKVSRLKDAFDRPFRTATTSALAPAPPASSSTAPALIGKRTEEEPLNSVWDIELDLNSPSPDPDPEPEPDLLPRQGQSAVAGGGGVGGGGAKRAREESPPWDIEDEAAQDDARSDSDGDIEEDDDVDMNMDLAPALRAKRRRA